MKQREKPLGDRNLIGSNVTKMRMLYHLSQKDLATNMQLMGVDINLSSLSKLEGQTRAATDREVLAIARIFNIKIDDLFKNAVIRPEQKSEDQD